MWNEFDTSTNMHDLRTREAVHFGLPESFSGPCYFLFESAENDQRQVGLAVFLDSGFDRYGVSRQPPFGRIAFRSGGVPYHTPMSVDQMTAWAGVLLDLADEREKSHLTIDPIGASTDVQSENFVLSIPHEQMKRLVGALLDGADALDNYPRVGRFPPRPYHL